MPAIVDRQTQQGEIHLNQAAAINAAFGGESYRVCEHSRAGWATCIHPHAIPSNSCHYGGYYVGGGVPIFGEGRYQSEGTWGWDYRGLVFQKHVSLHWSHHRYQGGTGAYKTDGPKLRHE
jgi:hypothetical protein